METFLAFRESPPATASVVMSLLVAATRMAAAFSIAVATAPTVLAVVSLVIKPAEFVMATAADVPLVAAAK